MISADKTISTNKLITTDRMAGKEKNSGRNKLTDGKAERVKATATEALPVVRGELALLIVLVINSLGVVLMLYSGSGISAISSVPYAFSEVFSKVSLGVWTDIFSDNSGLEPDDPQKEICAAVSAELYCRGRIRNRDRYP